MIVIQCIHPLPLKARSYSTIASAIVFVLWCDVVKRIALQLHYVDTYIESKATYLGR